MHENLPGGTFRTIRTLARFAGPGWIAMIADFDAASILTAAQTGISFGYRFVWFLILLIFPLYFIQEACGRIGLATGMGLGTAIRMRFSRKVSVGSSFPMALTDIITYVAEYSGIAIGLSLIGIPPYIGLPFFFVIYLLLVYRRKFRAVEVTLISITMMLIVAMVAALAGRGLVSSPALYVSSSPTFLFMLGANAGAVVMPFMLFYQSSATTHKPGTLLRMLRMETMFGAIATEVLMVITEMLFTGSGIFDGNTLSSSVMYSLHSVAGEYSGILFGIGIISAAFVSLVVISLASSWGIVESAGISPDNSFRIYVVESLPALLIAMLIPYHLSLILYAMVFLVFALIVPGIMAGIISSDRRLMGNLSSSMKSRIAYWSSMIVTISFGFMAIL